MVEAQELPPGLRIGLDGRNTGRAGGTGVATYARVLAETCRSRSWRPEWLIERDPASIALPPHTPIARMRRLVAAIPSSKEARAVAVGNDRAWLSTDVFRVAQVHFDLYRRPLRLRMENPPALMHWTYPLPLFVPGVPNLVTVHDLIPLLRPEVTGIRPARMERLLRMAIARADCVVTVSETVRSDIVRRLGVDPARVVNLYQAVDFPPALLAASDAATDICPSGSFVCLGSIEPRKNIGRLITAHGQSGTRRHLVLVGPDGAGAAGELSALSAHPHPDRVLRLPWTPRPQLVRAMRSARAVLFPSLAEGFGLPIAEAMTLGVPVLTARGGATEEIAGGAALLVDPLSPGQLAEGILRLDNDDALCARMIAAGLAGAGAFSIRAYGDRLERLYRDVLARSLPGLPRIT